VWRVDGGTSHRRAPAFQSCRSHHKTACRIVVEVSAADRTRLEAVVSDRNRPQKHVWRAQIVLLTADGCGTSEIMRRTGKAKRAVWRWQEQFGYLT
jgi:hypothetical protein